MQMSDSRQREKPRVRVCELCNDRTKKKNEPQRAYRNKTPGHHSGDSRRHASVCAVSGLWYETGDRNGFRERGSEVMDAVLPYRERESTIPVWGPRNIRSSPVSDDVWRKFLVRISWVSCHCYHSSMKSGEDHHKLVCIRKPLRCGSPGAHFGHRSSASVENVSEKFQHEGVDLPCVAVCIRRSV